MLLKPVFAISAKEGDGAAPNASDRWRNIAAADLLPSNAFMISSVRKVTAVIALWPCGMPD